MASRPTGRGREHSGMTVLLKFGVRERRPDWVSNGESHRDAGRAARIFIMTLSPCDGTGPHVRCLADVSRILKDAVVRKRLLKTRSDQELLKILTS